MIIARNTFRGCWYQLRLQQSTSNKYLRPFLTNSRAEPVTTTERRIVERRSLSSVSSSITVEDRKSLSEIVEEIKDPSIEASKKWLDFTQPMLLPEKAQKQVVGFKLFKETEAQHPNKIILVQNGFDFEAIGVHALLITHFLGKKLSEPKTIPRFRCKEPNLNQLVTDLVLACGFEVVICEELPIPPDLSGKKRKKQYKPPRIVRGIHDIKSEYLNENEKEFPMAAVFWTNQTGYSLIQYFVKENAMKVTSRMSEEGLWAKLSTAGLSPPLYLHLSSLPGAKRDSHRRSWQRKADRIARSVFGSVRSFRSEDPVQGFLQLIQSSSHSIDLSKIEVIKEDIRDRTAPPPLSTVAEIGLRPRPGSGVLPLLDYALAEKCPKVAKAWVERCIADPPPPEIALHIQKICRELSITTSSIPSLNGNMVPKKVIEARNSFALGILQSRLLQMLDSGESNLIDLHFLRGMLKSIYSFMADLENRDIVEPLLVVASREKKKSVNVEKTKFLVSCQECYSAISKVVKDDPFELEANSDYEAEPQKSLLLKLSDAARDEILDGLISFGQHPDQHLLNSELFEKDRKAIAKRQNDILDQIMKAAKEVGGQGLSVELDSEMGTCFFLSERPLNQANLIPSRHSKFAYICKDVDKAIAAYMGSLKDRDDWIQKKIGKMLKVLESFSETIVLASHVSIVLAALTNHTMAAIQNKWTAPDISRLSSPQSRGLSASNFWPYWMEKDSCVLNSVHLDKMSVLTGPNMAGKSTVLRSLAAIACLAVSGFYVPAEEVSLPFIDSVNLKTSVTDSPLEKQSSFAVEMTEMRHVLQDATEHTLVLIDELGKGTEVVGGTALSAAILKDLYLRRSFGILATHLHRIKELESAFADVEYLKMGIDESRKATWRVVPGFCEDSMGLEVALAMGIPPSIVERAEELLKSEDIIS